MELTAQPNSKRPYLKQSAKQEQTPQVVSDSPILRMCTTAHTSTHTHACTQTCTQLKEREREIQLLESLVQPAIHVSWSIIVLYGNTLSLSGGGAVPPYPAYLSHDSPLLLVSYLLHQKTTRKDYVFNQKSLNLNMMTFHVGNQTAVIPDCSQYL